MNFTRGVLLWGAMAWLAALGEAMTIKKNVEIDGKRCDIVSWTDTNGKERSIALVRADGDPGFSGGYIEQFIYFVGNVKKTGRAWNQSQIQVSGLGCAVNHHKGASASKSASTNAFTSFVFEGASHCLWRFKADYSGMGKTIAIVIDYFIADGRSDILWAVSFDCSRIKDKEINWDSRGPYVQFDWDGDGKFYEGPISGIRWGDKYKFKTVSFEGAKSSWDYQEPNTIPYMMLYKEAALGDIELGMVQTQPWEQQDAGGYWWASKNWGKTGKGMMENWNCPYQLNAYEGYSSEKMAWGTNFGFVGSSEYDRLDFKKKSGYPFQGYAVCIVLNRHSEGLTDSTISSMEAVQQTKLISTKGKISAAGPKYAGLLTEAPYQPLGWNHVYAAWSADTEANQASVNVNVGVGKLHQPTFIFNRYSGASPTVRLNSAQLSSHKDYFASVDSATKRLWITFTSSFSGAKNLVEIK